MRYNRSDIAEWEERRQKGADTKGGLNLRSKVHDRHRHERIAAGNRSLSRSNASPLSPFLALFSLTLPLSPSHLPLPCHSNPSQA